MKNNKSHPERKKKTNWQREILFWGIFLLIASGLYFSGYHTNVIGKVQQVFLSTGIIKPDLPENLDNLPAASREYYFVDQENRMRSLHDFKGQAVFLNVWATWCPPCIAEMPSIAALYEEFSDNPDVAFLLVSVDEDFETAREFMQSRNMELPIYHFRNRSPDAFNSSVIPTTYVLTPDGRLAVKKEGMARYDTDEFKEFLYRISSENQ